MQLSCSKIAARGIQESVCNARRPWHGRQRLKNSGITGVQVSQKRTKSTMVSSVTPSLRSSRSSTRTIQSSRLAVGSLPIRNHQEKKGGDGILGNQ